ncbi:hypothetical protein RND81_10G224100 [Saponaria officinalis]|uniref:Vesicle-fusing ATPase n=1 Tax=Saponaria officinalis TaxID=3572 RepID=A0AAW1I5V0_SAPOF
MEQQGDRIVNQLLSKLDGVERCPNLLVIATTNRKDLIDPALLRPGRIELQVYIGFPSLQARLEILRLISKPFVDKQLVDADVDMNEFAEWTEDFSEAVIRRAFHSEIVDPDNLGSDTMTSDHPNHHLKVLVEMVACQKFL